MRKKTILLNPLRSLGHRMGGGSQTTAAMQERSHTDGESARTKRGEKKPLKVGAGGCADGEGSAGVSHVHLGFW